MPGCFTTACFTKNTSFHWIGHCDDICQKKYKCLMTGRVLLITGTASSQVQSLTKTSVWGIIKSSWCSMPGVLTWLLSLYGCWVLEVGKIVREKKVEFQIFEKIFICGTTVNSKHYWERENISNFIFTVATSIFFTVQNEAHDYLFLRRGACSDEPPGK